MLYKVQPEHNLADLFKSEVYKQVAQFTAERQLVQKLGILDANLALNTTATALKLYYINVKHKNQLVLLGKIKQVKRELNKEREKHQSLIYRRRRVYFVSDARSGILLVM
jgi:hypothetical protein